MPRPQQYLEAELRRKTAQSMAGYSVDASCLGSIWSIMIYRIYLKKTAPLKWFSVRFHGSLAVLNLKMTGIASLKTRFNILFWLDRNCIAVSKPSKRHYKVRWRLAGERDPTTSVASQLLFGLIPLKTIVSTYDLKYRDIMTMIYTDMHIESYRWISSIQQINDVRYTRVTRYTVIYDIQIHAYNDK